MNSLIHICKLSILSMLFLFLLTIAPFQCKPAEANIFTSASKVIPSVIRSNAVRSLSMKAGKTVIFSARNIYKVLTMTGSMFISAAEKIFLLVEKHPKATGIGLGFVYASRHENVVKHVITEIIKLPVEIVSSLVGGASTVLTDGEGHFPFKFLLLIAGIVIAVTIKTWFRYGSKLSSDKSHHHEDT